ncbi:MAG: 3-phosphoshikimate 1-carboxyvinyltransferase [Phycisphaerales bacterium]|nr:3-phosphoshikimate 1-carboxyvinyltransferase [Phycisphaerales bacterium]
MSREDVTFPSDHPAAVLLRPLEDLPSVLAIPPLPRGKRGLFDVSLRTPGSKSLTNRALLLAALAEGESTLRSPLLEADDARRMRAALEQLGVGLSLEREGEDEVLRVRGVGGAWKTTGEVTVNLNNAGTATRFLAAAALLGSGGGSAPIVIDGNARMRERPIGELAEVLTQLGAKIEYVGRDGYPPLRIHPLAERKGPGRVLDIPTTQSSQFISAILMVAPWLAGGLTIRLTGEITSPTYIEMTIGLLQQVGAMVKTSEDLRVIRVGPPSAQTIGLKAFDYDVEPDASGATYFWAAAAINPGSMARVTGLSHRSLQGDADFPSLLARMGAVVEQHPATQAAPHGVANPLAMPAIRDESDPRTHFIGICGPGRLEPIMADLSKMPDTAMTLASVACFAPGMSILRGLRTLRVKETDRIEAMRNELTKIGVKIDCPVMGDHDVMGITPPPGDMALASSRVEFDTYDDHRMAMSLALIGLRRPNVFIKDPQCVAKTYPTFWRDLARLYSCT